MSIAERLAALKASSTDSKTPTSASAGITPTSAGGTRRLSVGLAGLGAMINLNALSPNAVPPRIIKRDPTPNEDSEHSPGGGRMTISSHDDNGEIRHVSTVLLNACLGPVFVLQYAYANGDDLLWIQLSLSRPAVPSMRRKHATASVRLQANAWAAEDLLPEGLSLLAPATRPCSLSSAGDQPSILSEGMSSVEGILEGENEDETPC
jgi:hypothetical protein